ncbi:hypothetical protein [Sandaracinus amylolyticus]|uniref:hypothetical protein n=1 Tax=Sandaracinus amylolyticus TaxID=927083 RepID=UPI0012ED1C57|nr:hypothetical protein [Sandaracinus amylolyticus]
MIALWAREPDPAKMVCLVDPADQFGSAVAASMPGDVTGTWVAAIVDRAEFARAFSRELGANAAHLADLPL